MAFDKAKFLARFIDEAKEHINKLNDGLLVLNKNPNDSETLNAVFRSAHTIKGSSRMMKLIPISEVAHKLEDTLDAFRQNKIQYSKELSDLLFKGIDAIEGMLDRVSAGDELKEAPADICEELEKAAQGEIKKKEKTEPEHDVTDKEPSLEKEETSKDEDSERTDSKEPSLKTEPDFSLPQKEKRSEDKKIRPPETVRIGSDKLDELIKLMGEIVSSHSRSKQRLADIKEIELLSKRNMDFLYSFENKDISSNGYKEEILEGVKSLYTALKKLTSVFKEDLNIQGLLTIDLQDRSLKMRMLPLSTIFDSFRRTVRYISRTSEKDIDFIIEGGDTELDKKIIEKISDSLLHMIRNSIDHGIEKPAQRLSIGKPETGAIRLSARYEGGNAVIKLSDDGAGIPVEKIKEKALKSRLFDKDELDSIPETEIINLIFHPGLSSSDIITDLSGRGVGMDVVKKNIIEDLKGSISIETKHGMGTSFHIRLPLTMAVIHVLFVNVSDMTFAVPANYIDEIIKIPETEIISVMDKKAVRLREQIIPIVNLTDILGLVSTTLNSTQDDERDFLILIASMGNEKLGVIIDSLLDEEDMVIKPLPSHMKDIQLVSGAIISGKNEIFNVLNMPKIIEVAKDMKIQARMLAEAADEHKTINILVVDDSISTREIEKGILESYGYSVSLAGDGIEGFEKAKSFPYDMIISDIEMPHLDGFSLTEKLRNDKEYKDTPIILVSSLDKEEHKKRGILAGADAYIVKGDFEQSELLDTVQSLVG
ncbi:MAG: hybrid sensor histidine kinase/response regulator [Desulfobacteraceae bacterium]|nr:hybrid sensor histidine kinase/response regulator [Desulfobacteraceae bacterium]